MAAGRWQRFWFGGGGRLSVACVRIGIAVAVLGSLQTLLLRDGDPNAYDPDGILQLLGSEIPPRALLNTLLVVAYASTLAMLVGLFSRISTAISLVSALALISYDVSFMPGWIRANNVVFLAHIAFLGARCGDALSVDAWMRKRRGLPPAMGNYKWSLQLVQLGIALMFLSAAAAKWANGGFTLSWVFSDSMRHHLLMQFDVLGNERTVFADWVIDNAFLYKGLAFGSMISQTLPTATVFLMNRPWARFACGSLFFAEAIGFGLLLGLWDLHWVPLYVAFIDWDRLIAWVRRRRHGKQPEVPAAIRPSRVRLVNVFVGGYLVIYIGTAFNPLPWDLKLQTYPFSRFPMFSVTRAKRPYDVHQSYDIIRGRFGVDSSKPIPERVRKWLQHKYAYRWMHREDDPAKLERKLGVVQRSIGKRCKCEVRGLRLHHAVLRSPAYPEPAGLTEHRIAVVGELTPDGQFRTAVGDVEVDGKTRRLVLRAVGLDLDRAQVLYWRGDALEPTVLEAARDGQSFAVEVASTDEPETFGLLVDQTRYLVERTGNTY